MPPATASGVRCWPSPPLRIGRKGDERLADVTMFAAQTDFSEPGELSLFISPSQLAMLESLMLKEGVLDSSKMGGAFALLRAHDLLWSAGWSATT
jgi:polyhydroxyalkanoate synthase subunit PhaC